LIEVRATFQRMEARRDELRERNRSKSELIAKLTSPKVVLDNQYSISARMRACFYLRTANTEIDAKVLAKVTQMKGESVLLRHEAAYCLGQMKQRVVYDDLIAVLRDREDDSIVRHECAEALGAIGDPSCIETLQAIANDVTEPLEVRETCDVALDRFKDLLKGLSKSAGEDEFNTADPAIVIEQVESSISSLDQALNSQQNSLYERYRAMFTLRNRAVNAKAENERTEAVLSLSKALLNTNQGALFRHEVAFVLGQLSHEASVPFLEKALADESLHEMVRHESAEALGGVGSEYALKVLRKYMMNNREARIVKESCEVALDAVEYWKEFEHVA
jgi:deoxyhypusine monooxygenase